MMYSEKLAVALKHNGKVLREFGDTVYLPFGQEYTIFIKNLNIIRCIASISIDGNDVGDGSGFLIPALGSIDIERSIKNGNLNAGNRFKFIERSAVVEKHRGIKVEDGLIQVTFEFEKQPQPYYNPYVHMDKNPWDGPMWLSQRNSTSDLIRSKGSNHETLRNVKLKSANTSDIQCSTALSSVNDVGITVPGSISHQQFIKAGTFVGDGISHTIVLRLLGETIKNKVVQTPIVVKTKVKCSTCGYVNRHNAKFCSQCGTGLQLV